MIQSKITLLMGHYGSGKTNLAVNYAVRLKTEARKVFIADLDMVNPFFRTTDSTALFTRLDIELIASPFANSNLEACVLPGEVMAIFDNPSAYSVIDVGGDNAGAFAIGQFAQQIIAQGAEVLLVYNYYRPLSRTAVSVRRMKEEIESASHVRFTGLVNNSNIGAETTAEDVLRSVPYAGEAAELCALPLSMTSARTDLLPGLTGKIPDLFGLNIIEVDKWRI
ncbi:MAG: hypothetical protein LBT44_05290 [Clostridiales bacterium]|jgi:energy-coupling factor transporter ATP-binding protein EcfA2|nr:hypothetical protein [Clostridiales bacterium]